MRIKLLSVFHSYAGRHYALVEVVGDERRVRALSRRSKGHFDAENYGGEVARRYNRRHDCKEEK